VKERLLQVCAECRHKRERCRAAAQHRAGNVAWVCPRCWKALQYDDFLNRKGE
jgi:hypothetical protein